MEKEEKWLDDFEEGFYWQDWLERHRWYVLFVVIGLVLFGLGFNHYWKGSNEKQNYRVEFLPSENQPSISQKLLIDVGGAVVKPGVYELAENARIIDALNAAGGLSDDADQQWFSQVINQAEKVRDGQKIYILSTDELKNKETEEQVAGSGLYQGTVAGSNTLSSVSVNSASQSELESLWGIGPVTAEAIISGRPYGSVEELLDRKIIKSNVWERNKDKLSL